jgi:hypothetical protein
MKPEAKDHELVIIQNILHNNSYPLQITQELQTTEKENHNATDNIKLQQKWVTFTLFGNETRHITNIFKHTNLRVAFKTKNNIQNHLQHNNLDYIHTEKLSQSGVYQLTCPDCNKKYTTLNSLNMLETGHSFRKIEDIMKILHFGKKGSYLN